MSSTNSPKPFEGVEDISVEVLKAIEQSFGRDPVYARRIEECVKRIRAGWSEAKAVGACCPEIEDWYKGHDGLQKIFTMARSEALGNAEERVYKEKPDHYLKHQDPENWNKADKLEHSGEIKTYTIVGVDEDKI